MPRFAFVIAGCEAHSPSDVVAKALETRDFVSTAIASGGNVEVAMDAEDLPSAQALLMDVLYNSVTPEVRKHFVGAAGSVRARAKPR
ncbi:MAG TPA: hypothetical protein VF533_16840 [Solirubrobacteraceae bacterium]|jgi:hypothetical protein